MRFHTLQEWLDWQQRFHPKAIDLGLERVAQVWRRLHPGPFPCRVITVAGTNGKGSSVAFLDAILGAAGYRVGCYTSPHLLRYNERIRVAGREAADADICRTFEQVEAARQGISLTYFEFGTLAALKIFSGADLDVAVLEVGLGGRLDAVNIIDPEAALITAIALDHSEWLGETRERIAVEKGGILRPGRPAVIADPDPPETLLQLAQELSADTRVAGRDYGFRSRGESWEWWGRQQRHGELPLPRLVGDFQLANAAAVLAVLESLREKLPVTEEAIAAGLRAARIDGRFQVLSGEPALVLDVAHNPQAAQALARNLAAQPCRGRTLALFSALRDKDIPGIVQAVQGEIDHWYLVPLEDDRATPLEQLRQLLLQAGVGAQQITAIPSLADALQQLRTDAGPDDRVAVFGSFLTVAGVEQELLRSGAVSEPEPG
jgi:dihydrofolate synthase/folylpolyglutamate synthase